MFHKISKLLSLFLVVLAVYLIYQLNPTPVELKPWFGVSWTIPLAGVLLAALALGIVGGFVYGGTLAFYNWSYRLKWQKTCHLQEQLAKARECIAAGDFKEALVVLDSLLRKDKNLVQAIALKADIYNQQGDLEESIKVLDLARRTNPNNAELLFLAARANALAGNLTACIDNLKLILQTRPNNLSANKLLAQTLEKQGKLKEAREVQEKVVKLSASQDSYVAEQEQLAALDLALIEADVTDLADRKDFLDDLLRSHKNYVPALVRIAEIAKELKQHEEVHSYYIQAFKHSGNVKYLDEVSSFWLSLEQPTRAVGAVLIAIREFEAVGGTSQQAKLFLAFLYHGLEMREEASKICEELAGDEDMRKGRVYNVLKIISDVREDRFSVACGALLKIAEADLRHDKQFPAEHVIGRVFAEIAKKFEMIKI